MFWAQMICDIVGDDDFFAAAVPRTYSSINTKHE
jgi:hypothetical protein